VTHTDNGVILKDKDGGETHVALEMPEQESTPTYVQNEEQKEGGLWKSIAHPITEQEYQEKIQKDKDNRG
jgi:hypothetical protein